MSDISEIKPLKMTERMEILKKQLEELEKEEEPVLEPEQEQEQDDKTKTKGKEGKD